jgi:hypothetical protein
MKEKDKKSESSSDEMNILPPARFKNEKKVKKDKEKYDKKRDKRMAKEASVIHEMDISNKIVRKLVEGVFIRHNDFN